MSMGDSQIFHRRTLSFFSPTPLFSSSLSSNFCHEVQILVPGKDSVHEKGGQNIDSLGKKKKGGLLRIDWNCLKAAWGLPYPNFLLLYIFGKFCNKFFFMFPWAKSWNQFTKAANTSNNSCTAELMVCFLLPLEKKKKSKFWCALICTVKRHKKF